MRRWAGPAFLVLLAVAAPLLVPARWAGAAWVPDCAVLAVVALGFRGTADRAALLGVVIGLCQAPFVPEPFLLRPFLLGSAGWLAALVASALHRDRAPVRMVVAAAAFAFVRAGSFAAAAVIAGEAARWTLSDSFSAVQVLAIGTAVAALAAPAWISIAARWRLLDPLERSFRDV